MSATAIQKELRKHARKEKVAIYQNFFKTGPGQYGEGDVFIAVAVPDQRRVAKKYKDISLKQIEILLNSKVHEDRLTAVFILVDKYTKADNKKEIADFYVKNRRQINNWDLVDSSAHKILGEYLKDKDRKLLYKFARSKNLWERRIAIIATFAYIKDNDFKDALKLAEILVHDDHDLIHKAVGWVLREIGNKNLAAEEKFLKKHYKTMPRTMLRYAIEKFPEKKRKYYMK